MRFSQPSGRKTKSHSRRTLREPPPILAWRAQAAAIKAQVRKRIGGDGGNDLAASLEDDDPPRRVKRVNGVASGPRQLDRLSIDSNTRRGIVVGGCREVWTLFFKFYLCTPGGEKPWLFYLWLHPGDPSRTPLKITRLRKGQIYKHITQACISSPSSRKDCVPLFPPRA